MTTFLTSHPCSWVLFSHKHCDETLSLTVCTLVYMLMTHTLYLQLCLLCIQSHVTSCLLDLSTWFLFSAHFKLNMPQTDVIISPSLAIFLIYPADDSSNCKYGNHFSFSFPSSSYHHWGLPILPPPQIFIEPALPLYSCTDSGTHHALIQTLSLSSGLS